MSERPTNIIHADTDLVVATGALGWSNARTGVELYHSWDDGRWGSRVGRYSRSNELILRYKQGTIGDTLDADQVIRWGRLLADDLEALSGEGSTLVIIALPRFSKMKTGAVVDLVQDALRPRPPWWQRWRRWLGRE